MLRKAYNAAFTEPVTAAATVLTRELQAALRALDERHNAALWAMCARHSITQSSLPPRKRPASLRPAKPARMCRTICPPFSTPTAASALGRQTEPTHRKHRIFACPPLLDPAVEGL